MVLMKENAPKGVLRSYSVVEQWLVNENELGQEIKNVIAVGDVYFLYSDGACRGNPGPGSWGILGKDREGNTLFEASGVEFNTTNNQMELQGVIECLKHAHDFIRDKDGEKQPAIEIYTDSKYVVDGFNSWMAGWKARGWRKSDGKAPENLSHWQEVDKLSQYFDSIGLNWIKGHSGHPENERCDQIANLALDEAGF